MLPYTTPHPKAIETKLKVLILLMIDLNIFWVKSNLHDRYTIYGRKEQEIFQLNNDRP